MQMPDLHALQRGDAAAWDMAFPWLWPAAFGAAQVTLQPYLPAEVEDVAIESLEALVEKVRELKSVEELKPLVARGESFTNTFLVERDLAATLEQARSFVKQRTSQ